MSLTKTQKCKYHPVIDVYMNAVRSGEEPASEEVIMAMDLIERKLNEPGVIIKGEMIEKAIELVERYFGFALFPWEKFIYGLVHAFYEKTDTVVFDEFFVMMGRGNGKNGFISGLTWYFSTHYHGIKGYNVDIIANSKDQAGTSFGDIHEVLEDNRGKLKRFFYWNLEKIVNLVTRSTIRYHTSNSKTKDGKRSACLIFDEIHEYEDYSMIKVFTSGFGKRKHSRTFYITTDGYVRGGVIDDMKNVSKQILNGEPGTGSMGFLPLIYKVKDKDEAQDPKAWVKANPSLPFLPELQHEINKEFGKMAFFPHVALDFLTKRMNIPAQDNFLAVAPWEQIQATNQPIPWKDIAGASCIGAIDYALIRDFVSVGLLFRVNGKFVFLEHTFVCHKALEIQSRPIKFPVQEAVDKGLITIVREENVAPEIVGRWFLEMGVKYNITDIRTDSYRAPYLQAVFNAMGLPLTEIRSGPITHSKLSPTVESAFQNKDLILGDNMTMRWYINNTYQEIDGKGNITYKKIEPQTRKTDGFFCLVHALTGADKLEQSSNYMDFDVVAY